VDIERVPAKGQMSSLVSDGCTIDSDSLFTNILNYMIAILNLNNGSLFTIFLPFCGIISAVNNAN